MAEQRNNTGVLFLNSRKTKDSQPDYQGNATADGVEYWLAAWKKTSKQGVRYLSLALTPKDDESQASVSDDIDW